MNYQSTTNASEFNGSPINNGNQGQFFCYDIILQKVHERMQLMTGLYSRVMFVRFDLRFPQEYQSIGGNEEISHLFKMMKENARANKRALHFAWVREQSKAASQHYHVCVWLDASKVSNHLEFLGEVTRVWGHVLGCNAAGLVDWCERDSAGNASGNGLILQQPVRKASSEERIAQEQDFWAKYNYCFEWASYLAKVNQKEGTPPSIRRFGVSQIR